MGDLKIFETNTYGRRGPKMCVYFGSRSFVCVTRALRAKYSHTCSVKRIGESQLHSFLMSLQ